MGRYPVIYCCTVLSVVQGMDGKVSYHMVTDKLHFLYSKCSRKYPRNKVKLKLSVPPEEHVYFRDSLDFLLHGLRASSLRYSW